MSRRTHSLTFISFMFLAIPLWSVSALNIEVQVERAGPVQYLPIYFAIAFTNISDAAIELPKPPYFEDNMAFSTQGPLDLRCYSREPGCRTGVIELFKLEPGKKHILRIEVAKRTGILGPGAYQVKVVWDSRNAPKGYKGYAETEWIPIIVQEATGDDKGYIEAAQKAYPKYYKCFLIEGINIKEGFKKYPTSYYCGYTLAFSSSLDDIAAPGNPNGIFQQYGTFVGMYKRNQQEKRIDILDAANERVIEAIEAFLKAGREEFPYNYDLRANLAGRLAIQGKYERARSICETLIAKKSTQEKNCSEFLQHLKEKGYLKQ